MSYAGRDRGLRKSVRERKREDEQSLSVRGTSVSDWESQSACERLRRNGRIAKINNNLPNKRTSTYNNIMPVRVYEKLRNIIVDRCRVGHVIEKPRTERANVRFALAERRSSFSHRWHYAHAHAHVQLCARAPSSPAS